MILSADRRRELAGWLRLGSVNGLGGTGQRALLKRFGTPENVLLQPSAALATVVGAPLANALLASDEASTLPATLAWLESSEANSVLALADVCYPSALLQLPDPPCLIYAKGNLEILERPALAIVGSRNATPAGLRNAAAFAGTLAASGYAVVSGLALGIDAAAHRGALDAGGETIAVVGTGLDRIYPARNADLARLMVEQGRGVMVSEFPLGTAPLAHNFPRRNRIISGLSRGVLVVEAAVESGSLITARLAAEQGREVFAVPGSIHSPQSRGCHLLIKQGAKLVESIDDILSEFGQFVPTSPAIEAAVDDDRHCILATLGHDPLTIEQLSARSGLTAEALLAMLFELELAGKLACLPGGRYQRLQ